MNSDESSQEKSQQKTRILLPFLLNGHVYLWLFDPGGDNQKIRIPMRRYAADKMQWRPEYVDVTFVRQRRHHAPFCSKDSEGKEKKSEEFVEETYYTCESPLIDFTSDNYPVIK